MLNKYMYQMYIYIYYRLFFEANLRITLENFLK